MASMDVLSLKSKRTEPDFFAAASQSARSIISRRRSHSCILDAVLSVSSQRCGCSSTSSCSSFVRAAEMSLPPLGGGAVLPVTRTTGDAPTSFSFPPMSAKSSGPSVLARPGIPRSRSARCFGFDRRSTLVKSHMGMPATRSSIVQSRGGGSTSNLDPAISLVELKKAIECARPGSRCPIAGCVRGKKRSSGSNSSKKGISSQSLCSTWHPRASPLSGWTPQWFLPLPRTRMKSRSVYR
mmetsp:Transcript_8033/g.30110  ORF Transcript_8033/g.30110 Transcript_8033/m.30110 type:complete len:239 (+) Transcript_8033:492-1208(+)